MNFSGRSRAAVAVLLALGASPAVHASCGSSFCAVNTQWEAQGVWQGTGWHLDFRQEYVDQDQLRQGSRDIGIGDVPSHHEELRTVNHNSLLSIDYGFNANWGMSVSLPYVDREHEHLHHHHGELLVERWNISAVGDARVLGRYRGDGSAFGWVFGFKLPTGATDFSNPAGDEAERSLQPGTGTTDAVIGLNWRHADPAASTAWFVQAQYQQALAGHDGFKPGRQVHLDAGLRYAVSGRFGLMLQSNLVWKGHDVGAEAEPDDSGSRQVYLTPGISFAATDRIQLYAFLQQPLYQHVTGVQLVADRSIAGGLSLRF